MRTENISIQFDAEKLAAINIYIREKGLSLEEELQKSAEALYVKHVPTNVRAYIDAKNGVEVSTKKPAKPSRSEHPILKQE